MKNKTCLNFACRNALAMQQAACLGETQGSKRKVEGQQTGFTERTGLELQHHHTVFAKTFDF